MAKLVSVCVGMPQTFMSEADDGWSAEWSSAIHKSPVSAPVWVGKLNLVGDKQFDLKNHGGPDQAILGYSAEHYAYWRATLPDHEWQYGSFGENFTIESQNEDSVCLGDVYAVGAVRIEVTRPRKPCYKIARRNGIKDLTAQVDETGYHGWYYRVLDEGDVQVGMEIELIERVHPRLSIRMMNKVHKEPAEWPDLAQELAASPATTEGWRRKMVKAIAKASSSNEG